MGFVLSKSSCIALRIILSILFAFFNYFLVNGKKCSWKNVLSFFNLSISGTPDKTGGSVQLKKKV